MSGRSAHERTDRRATWRACHSTACLPEPNPISRNLAAAARYLISSWPARLSVRASKLCGLRAGASVRATARQSERKSRPANYVAAGLALELLVAGAAGVVSASYYAVLRRCQQHNGGATLSPSVRPSVALAFDNIQRTYRRQGRAKRTDGRTDAQSERLLAHCEIDTHRLATIARAGETQTRAKGEHYH